MIAQMPDSLPKVARFRGDIAIYVDDPDSEGGNHGFLLPPASASALALNILAAVGDTTGDPLFAHDATAIEMTQGGHDEHDTFAFLVLTLTKARIRVALNATQLAELAQAAAGAVAQIDRPHHGPRPDR